MNVFINLKTNTKKVKIFASLILIRERKFLFSQTDTLCSFLSGKSSYDVTYSGNVVSWFWSVNTYVRSRSVDIWLLFLQHKAQICPSVWFSRALCCQVGQVIFKFTDSFKNFNSFSTSQNLGSRARGIVISHNNSFSTYFKHLAWLKKGLDVWVNI